jgi:hypothetical protein
MRWPSHGTSTSTPSSLPVAVQLRWPCALALSSVSGGYLTSTHSSVGLHQKARTVTGVEGWPYRAVADAMEVIPRTLIQNAGGNAMRVLTELRAKHAGGEHNWGVNGETGKIVDMKEYGLFESASVKIQTLKTAVEVRARHVLRKRERLIEIGVGCSCAASRGRRGSGQEARPGRWGRRRRRRTDAGGGVKPKYHRQGAWIYIGLRDGTGAHGNATPAACMRSFTSVSTIAG